MSRFSCFAHLCSNGDITQHTPSHAIPFLCLYQNTTPRLPKKREGTWGVGVHPLAQVPSPSLPPPIFCPVFSRDIFCYKRWKCWQRYTTWEDLSTQTVINTNQAQRPQPAVTQWKLMYRSICNLNIPPAGIRQQFGTPSLPPGVGHLTLEPLRGWEVWHQVAEGGEFDRSYTTVSMEPNTSQEKMLSDLADKNGWPRTCRTNSGTLLNVSTKLLAYCFETILPS